MQSPSQQHPPEQRFAFPQRLYVIHLLNPSPRSPHEATPPNDRPPGLGFSGRSSGHLQPPGNCRRLYSEERTTDETRRPSKTGVSARAAES